MTLRVEWMICDWIESQEQSQEEIHRLLVTRLRQLHPTQEPPLLIEDNQLLEIWVWASDWGETLILNNETWWTLFRQTNPQIDFPVDLTQVAPLEDASIMALHNEVNLEQFLVELTF